SENAEAAQALADRRDPSAPARPAPPSVVAANESPPQKKPVVAVGGKAAQTLEESSGATADPALASAKGLYNAGRYAEALPRFEALKAKSPEADLYAARCLQRTRG